MNEKEMPLVDDYTKDQMAKLAEEMNAMQLRYDTRLLAALFAGRAAMLHVSMINAGVMTQKQAQHVWNYAGELIDNPVERETKILNMVDGEVFDPAKVN